MIKLTLRKSNQPIMVAIAHIVAFHDQNITPSTGYTIEVTQSLVEIYNLIMDARKS